MLSYELLLAYDEYCFEVHICGRVPVSFKRWMQGEE